MSLFRANRFPGRHLIARHPHTVIALSYDCLMMVAVWSACWLMLTPAASRFANWLPLSISAALVTVVELLVCIKFGLYRGIWRYASIHDVKQIVQAAMAWALFVPAILYLSGISHDLPKIIYFLNPLLLVLVMGGGRILYRWWTEHRPYATVRSKGQPLLILGAGDAGLKLVQQLTRSQSWFPIGLLDDDPRKIGLDLAGLPILGGWDDLKSAVEATGAKHAILAVAVANNAIRRRAFQFCEQAGVELMVLPGIDEVLQDEVLRGELRLNRIRHIEVDDLLGRDPVMLNDSGLKQWIGKKTVLVTGAGGSIGAELAQQLARYQPRRIVLVDHSEFALYRITETFVSAFPRQDVKSLIADIRDTQRMEVIFRQHAPDLVFHAAAYKHVPLMESENAAQAIENNVMGTRVLADMCLRHDVEKLVFVSTDKAVNPTNVMGATKRMAEMTLQHRHARDGLPVVMVRFGNVLGSTGSVIPKFKEQIAQGGPVTVTHPEITRFFMSISEATQLLLQAGLMGRGGEVFVMDMGEPVRIVDLARDMIRLSGFHDDDIEIQFVGLRPGEKLYEELLANDETTLPTLHPKLRIQRSLAEVGPVWDQAVTRWLQGVTALSDAEVRAGLTRFIPEYRPAPGLEAGPFLALGGETQALFPKQ